MESVLFAQTGHSTRRSPRGMAIAMAKGFDKVEGRFGQTRKGGIP
ncbi:hypothetical protein Mame_04754 (plasmid) [Martelella mediterranea DSM 17316]|uniref:Uncharacterized protein n=1 Tax=Martelella mediterranea DSM 17316 TaxID=1122214 RepID=A0A1U9Z8R9_9HYPH|nr:hypothetical protein Mame_04754 [Martelella mediterranea DSM 17316]